MILAQTFDYCQDHSSDFKNQLINALINMDKQQLTYLIKNSNISKASNLISYQQLCEELTTLFQVHQKSNKLAEYFQSLPFLLNFTLSQKIEAILIKYFKPNSNDMKSRLCYCGELVDEEQNNIICLNCQNKLHKDCLKFMDSIFMKQCPKCIITNLDPLSQAQKVFSMHKLNSNQKQINIEANLINIQTDQYVQLRCIKLCNNFEFNYIEWPTAYQIIINGIIYHMSEKKSKSKTKFQCSFEIPPTQHKRKTKIKISLLNSHEKEIKNQNYLIALVVVKQITYQQYKQNILKTVPNETIYRCQILSMFNQKKIEKKSKKYQISLICPLNKTRIQIPVKGKKCLHLQCFDFMNFVTTSSYTKKFKCPVFKCTQRCFNLVVDPILLKILQQQFNESEIVQKVIYDNQGVTFIKQKVQKNKKIKNQQLSNYITSKQSIINQPKFKTPKPIKTNKKQIQIIQIQAQSEDSYFELVKQQTDLILKLGPKNNEQSSTDIINDIMNTHYARLSQRN